MLCFDFANENTSGHLVGKLTHVPATGRLTPKLLMDH